MQFLETEIREITEMVWASMFDRDLQPGTSPNRPTLPYQMLMGLVHLNGDWEGIVTLNCSAALARQLAATLFGISVQSTTSEQTQDVLGELANIVGGNIKRLLPESSQLSLPSVKEGSDYLSLLPEGEIISEVAFECLGEPVLIILLKTES
jgi:chemotaxis protein CheX